MWYSDKAPKPELDYSKPIAASNGYNTFLLLRRTERNVFDWFDVKEGRWNSSYGWDKPEDAVNAYGSYRIRNVEINLKDI